MCSGGRINMKVQILSHTPNIENVIASSGRLCYSKVGVSELLEKHSQEANNEFVEKLANMGHMSPLEHVSFTFAIEGVSRALSHQLVRHRIASYSQQSQRYVNLEETFKYITPPSIISNGMEDNWKMSMNAISKLYESYSSNLEFEYISQGMSKRDANKKAIGAKLI